MLLFFFKQKTAYEMRISDWSSDVCSSDLQVQHPRQRQVRQVLPLARGEPEVLLAVELLAEHALRHFGHRVFSGLDRSRPLTLPSSPTLCGACRRKATTRSEEHTSELQSLMRISYAAFCSKKKNKNKTEET